MFRPTLLNICRKYCLHIFSLFSVLFLSNLSITECIFNIIVTSFKSRQFLYQLHIWYCMFTPPPPSDINFCILWYNLILPCLSTLTERLLSIQILKKSWRGMWKDKFYMFSVSNWCRMCYWQIPVKRNFIQIHAQILNLSVQIHHVQTDILEASILYPSSACISQYT